MRSENYAEQLIEIFKLDPEEEKDRKLELLERKKEGVPVCVLEELAAETAEESQNLLAVGACGPGWIGKILQSAISNLRVDDYCPGFGDIEEEIAAEYGQEVADMALRRLQQL